MCVGLKSFWSRGTLWTIPECFHVYIQFIEGAASQSVVLWPLFVVFAQCLVVQVSGFVVNVCWPEVFLVHRDHLNHPWVFPCLYTIYWGCCKPICGFLTAFCSLCSVSCGPGQWVCSKCVLAWSLFGRPSMGVFMSIYNLFEGAASQSVVFWPLFVVFAQCLVVQVSGFVVNACWPGVFLVQGVPIDHPWVFPCHHAIYWWCLQAMCIFGTGKSYGQVFLYPNNKFISNAASLTVHSNLSVNLWSNWSLLRDSKGHPWVLKCQSAIYWCCFKVLFISF